MDLGRMVTPSVKIQKSYKFYEVRNVFDLSFIIERNKILKVFLCQYLALHLEES